MARIASLMVVAVGAVVLVGWVLDIGVLKSLLPTWPTMKVNTALGFVFGGIALGLLRVENAERRKILAGRFAAGVLLLLGGLTLVEYGAGMDLGLDQVFMVDPSESPGARHAGRMSSATAMGFVLAGLALLTLDVETRRGMRPAQWLALFVAGICFIAIIVYIYGVEALLIVGPFSSMALHTALALLVLAAGTLAARPDRGWVAFLFGGSIASVSVRRLLPAAILLPPLLGWLLWVGRQAGSYGPEFGLAILATATIASFCALIVWNARGLVGLERERNRAEELLHESEQQLFALVQQAPVSIAMLDRNMRYIVTSKRWHKEYGRGHGDLVGKSHYDVHPDLPEFWKDIHRRAQAGEYLHKDEDLWVQSDGRKCWLSWSVHPWRQPGGAIGGVIISSEDVTQRKLAEETLRASEARFRAMADNAPVLIWLSGRDKLCTWFNRRWLDFVGRSMEQEVGNGWAENVHPDDFDRCLEIYSTNFDARRQFTMEYRLRRHDGAWRWVLDHGMPCHDADGTFEGYIGSCVDVTESKESIDALRESQQRFQTLAESLPHLVWTSQPDGRFDYVTRQWVDYTGRPVDEHLGSGWMKHVHPEDRKRVEGRWAQSIDRGGSFEEEFRIRRAGDGEYRWFKIRALPLRNAEGRITKWFGSNTDIDDIKNAEQKLQLQINRLDLLRRITQAIGERQDLHSIYQVVVGRLEDDLPIDFGCVFQFDPHNEILTVKCVGARSGPLAHQLSMDENTRIDIDANGLTRCLQGELVYEPDLREVPFSFPQRLLRGGLKSLVVAPLIVESEVFGVLVAARAEPRSFSSPDSEFLRQLSEHVALAAHQIRTNEALQHAYDDLRQSQQVAVQQERLRALGQMASGVAHDINNAITPVSLYAGLLLEREKTLSEESRESLQIIERAIDDVAGTVGRLKEFYRQRETSPALTSVDLNLLVEHVLELTRARWSDMPLQKGAVIEVSRELAPTLPLVMGIENEIRDALTNLIFNAADAIPNGGAVVVRTRAVQTPASTGSAAGRHVCVEVSDTGMGMDEETRRRCLEPFFTTKGERGTGLGLAMVYGVAQRHRADIEIESEPGRGTTVRLSFTTAEAAAGGSAGDDTQHPPTEGQRVLIVDDDPLLLRSLRDVLEADTHTVVSANGGRAGIDAFRAAQKDGVPFDVVITDLGMPYVDGRMVAKEIRAESPQVRLILLTGWGERLVATGEIPFGVDLVLSKPPKIRKLREAMSCPILREDGPIEPRDPQS